MSWRGIASRPRPAAGSVGGDQGRLPFEGDGAWWAWVLWVQETCGRHVDKVVQVQAASLCPLEPPDAYQDVPRRVLGLGGHIRGIS